MFVISDTMMSVCCWSETVSLRSLSASFMASSISFTWFKVFCVLSLGTEGKDHKIWQLQTWCQCTQPQIFHFLRKKTRNSQDTKLKRKSTNPGRLQSVNPHSGPPRVWGWRVKGLLGRGDTGGRGGRGSGKHAKHALFPLFF